MMLCRGVTVPPPPPFHCLPPWPCLPPCRWILSTLIRRDQFELFCGGGALLSDPLAAGPGCLCNAGPPDLLAEGVAPEDLGPLQEQLRLMPGGIPLPLPENATGIPLPLCEDGLRCVPS